MNEATNLVFEYSRVVGSTLLAVPLALLYDRLLLLVASAWLIRESREQGFLPWEKTALTLEVDPPVGADGLRPDQQRLADWMVASLGKAQQP